MTRTPALPSQGLSLIELLLGLAIGALLLAPLMPMVQTTGAAARITGDQLALERDADFALERIAARIRARDLGPPLAGTPANGWLAPVSYVVSNGTLVERQDKNPDLALADSVTDFQMSAPAASSGRQVVQVSLSLARGDASVTANTTVRLGGMQ